jgi:bifunctional DNA-binding transcriptional regulator/antitoxin component of YhaV-PrlF toxin-antitoxin module
MMSVNNNDITFLKCFGSTTIGPRGQAVIPVNARKGLDMGPGTTLLVFQAFGGRGLFLLKADAIEALLNKVSEGLSTFEKQMNNYLPNTETKPK